MPLDQEKKFNDSLILNTIEMRKTIINYFTLTANKRPKTSFLFITTSYKTEYNTVLIYRATRDGFKAKDFHDKCDEKGPTLTIIKTTTGHVIL